MERHFLGCAVTAQKQGGQPPYLKPSCTKNMMKCFLHSVLNGLAQPPDSERLSTQISRIYTLCPSEKRSPQFPHSQSGEARPAACNFLHEVPSPLSHSLWFSPSAPEEVVLALRLWDLEAEQLLGASLLLFFLFFSDPRPRDRLRLLQRLREPT